MNCLLYDGSAYSAITCSLAKVASQSVSNPVKITISEKAFTAGTSYTLYLPGIKNPVNRTPQYFTAATDTLRADITITVYKKVDSFVNDGWLKLLQHTAYDIYGTDYIKQSSNTARTGTASSTVSTTATVIPGSDAVSMDLTSGLTAVTSGGAIIKLDSAFVLPDSGTGKIVVVDAAAAGTWTTIYFK
mmetsp:Transcript_27005/g.4980  ORF Transcript_27005/g.4980 Transcript_27005/m.4980 type:complete len:188 (+) Transcript_27005:2647-3210(+)|eukprot:CAMPEP_0168313434 /NCGR_PEP_ID=MMETSP0210-20121227/1898_1 /TAXON_ID=40633 /ORGANISM="Condylostoma magnum, Strain COL2" /LENGTH=187 /DNA_ID=CAMNT_0008269909 /DNA_START=19324 /DNA_END=19887 /DNA_ORIENTATION=-